MKKRLSLRLLTAGTAFLLSAAASFPAWAGQITGHLDTVSASSITGWAWDKDEPDKPLTIELTISGESMGPGGYTVVTTTADRERADLGQVLGSTKHGFTYNVDWSQYQGKSFTVTAVAVNGDVKTPLIGSHSFNREETASVVVPAEVAKPATVEAATPAKTASETKADDLKANMALGPGFAGNAGLTPTSSNNKKTGNQTGPGASKPHTIETGEPDKYLGSFRISGYCNCANCSGGHTKTYSGAIPQADHTISADLNRFPLGTKLLIDGIVYTVEDKGSSVVDDRLDIFFATHQEALDFGLQTKDVYSVK